MTGRMTFTAQEIDNARKATDDQVRHFLDLSAEGLIKEGFETTYFNGLVLSLDRWFMQRAREVSGAGTTPLNELELIADGLTREGLMPELDEIDYEPKASVLGLHVGDDIELTADQFVNLSEAVFAELDEKFKA